MGIVNIPTDQQQQQQQKPNNNERFGEFFQ